MRWSGDWKHLLGRYPSGIYQKLLKLNNDQVIASRIGSCCFKHCGRTASVSKCLSAVCHCFIVLIWLCKIYSPAITMRVIASALATVLPISSNYIALKCANFQRNMDLWDFYHSYSDIDSVTSQSTIIRTIRHSLTQSWWCAFVAAQYEHWTDGWTDGQKSCVKIARQ